MMREIFLEVIYYLYDKLYLTPVFATNVNKHMNYECLSALTTNRDTVPLALLCFVNKFARILRWLEYLNIPANFSTSRGRYPAASPVLLIKKFRSRDGSPEGQDSC